MTNNNEDNDNDNEETSCSFCYSKSDDIVYGLCLQCRENISDIVKRLINQRREKNKNKRW